MWASRKPDGLVAGTELDVEPGDQGMDKVVTADLKLKWRRESQVLNLDCVEVEGNDSNRVRDDSFHFDSIDEGL